MLTLNNLNLVAATHEVAFGDYIYRIHSGEGGVIVRRTKIEDNKSPIWSHGTLVQTFDIDNTFKPQCLADAKKLTSIEEALGVITKNTCVNV